MKKQMLEQGWFVKGSIADTVKNLIQTADLDFLSRVNEADFEQRLIEEIRFIGIYEADELPEVERYIRDHSKQLYQEAKQLAKKRISEEIRRSF